VSNKQPGDPSDRSRFTRQIDEAFEDVSKLAGSNVAPTDFYQQFLTRALTGIGAPAGAVWLRTPQGFLQVACQVNLERIGLEAKRGGRECHNEVLRHVFQANPPRSVILEPQGRLAGVAADANSPPAANLSDFYALFAPIVGTDKQSFGLLEVFQDSGHNPQLYPTFIQYATQMAGYASQYHAYGNTRQATSAGSEKVFAQVEAFARLIHGTLNPTEVAYHVANEGRRLIECDRLCVAVRHGGKATVEAVSGADVVEKASTHVRRMKKLFDAVLKFNDRLTFAGTRDDALPPEVLHALDEYLAESQPKLLVVQPIRDEREKKDDVPARSALLLESFNPPDNVEPLVQRMELVGKHAAPALYNAAELKRIPFKMLWKPVLWVQNGVGGKTRFITLLVCALVVALALVMVFVPYQLKMDAKGQFKPRVEKAVYAPHEGEVIEVLVKPGQRGVKPGDAVVKLFNGQLERQLGQLDGELAKAIADAATQENALGKTPTDRENQATRNDLIRKKADAEFNRGLYTDRRSSLIRTYNLIDSERGFFHARAPELDLLRVSDPRDRVWTVLNNDNRTELNRRTVKTNEPLVRLGAVDGPWRVELRIPQRNIGQVQRAFSTPGMHQVEESPDPTSPTRTTGKRFLPVDVLFAGSETESFKGKLYFTDLGAEAVPNQSDHNESEPIVIAYVTMDPAQFSEADRKALFVAGLEVRTKIRCGSHSLGYAWFHGVWEWFYEHVVFFF